MGPHGGGPHGGGPHGGGPRGGGPRGGFHGGPRGFGGPARWHGGPPPHTPVGNNHGGGESITAKITGSIVENAIAREDRRRKFGFFKGTILGLKLSTTGSMKEEVFKAELSATDKLFQDRRLTTKEMRKRKMASAAKYFGYLHKIGFFDDSEYNREMQEFANEIGATYTPTTPSRTR